MIYTVTLNPSLDYIATVLNFTLGRVNRTEHEIVYPGGKGVNVSLMLNNLNIESTVLGFIAGFTGDEIRKKILERGCLEQLIPVEAGWSRINIKVRSNEESELNGQGPDIDSAAIERLYGQMDGLRSEDVLVLAGSVPSSMPTYIYSDIMKRIKSKRIKVVVDATKDLLVNTLEHNPFLIKPNHNELGEIFGVELKDKIGVILHGKKLQNMGARNVLVSMASEGAVFICEDGQVLESAAPQGKPVNSVGAGDSMVAGFIAGYLKKHDYKYAFYMGIAAGSASVFSEGFATLPEVQAIFKSIVRLNPL